MAPQGGRYSLPCKCCLDNFHICIHTNMHTQLSSPGKPYGPTWESGGWRWEGLCLCLDKEPAKTQIQRIWDDEHKALTMYTHKEKGRFRFNSENISDVSNWVCWQFISSPEGGDEILVGPTRALTLEDHLPICIYMLVPERFGYSKATKLLHVEPTWIRANHGDTVMDMSIYDHTIILTLI